MASGRERAARADATGARIGTRAELLALLDLLHPLPVALTVLAGGAFATVAAHGAPPAQRLVLFLVSLTLTQLAISVHNDYCDRDLDARARPWRALPRGIVSSATALGLALALLAAGLLASVPLGPVVLLLAALGTGAGLLYNARLKRTAWSWVPFWLGFPTLVVWAFAAVERLDPRLVTVYLVGAPLVLAVHLADTLPDVEADARYGVRGLAHRLGVPRARLACWLALGLALALALILRPFGQPPGPLYPLAGALLLLAVVVGGRRTGRAHWLAVVAGAIALAIAWTADLAG